MLWLGAVEELECPYYATLVKEVAIELEVQVKDEGEEPSDEVEGACWFDSHEDSAEGVCEVFHDDNGDDDDDDDDADGGGADGDGDDDDDDGKGYGGY